MKLSGKQQGLGEKSQNEIHLPASMQQGLWQGGLGGPGVDREGACRPRLDLLWGCGRGGGVRAF